MATKRGGDPFYDDNYDEDFDYYDYEDKLLSRRTHLNVPPSHVLNELALGAEKMEAGQIVFTARSKKLLNDMLDKVYVQLQPKKSDWEAREDVISSVTDFMSYKIPRSSISVFGSFVMDLFTASSDLDFSLNLLDGNREHSREDQVFYLRKVARALYGLQNGPRQRVKDIQAIYRATVPVVKFVDCKTGVQCDIAVANNDGIFKSHVLGMLSTMDSRFRQLCHLVKAWAKKHDVNSSATGTLSSLSICVLVAFHLQTLPTPIFPPLSVFLEGLQFPATESFLENVASRVKGLKERGFGKDNTDSVPELFVSFFVKLVAVKGLWEKGLCASTYEGRWISKVWPKNHIACISVEDFVDRTQNVTRSVPAGKKFNLIYQALVSTVSNLKYPVSHILEAEKLKGYLFGSMRQGLDPAELTSLNTGRLEGGRRPQVTRSGVPKPASR